MNEREEEQEVRNKKVNKASIDDQIQIVRYYNNYIIFTFNRTIYQTRP